MKFAGLLLNAFTVIVFSFFVGYWQSVILISFGVNPLITMLTGFFIGLYLPNTLIRWIYKEEIKELESPKNEEK